MIFKLLKNDSVWIKKTAPKFLAFTLAEVLLTLCIIGVLAFTLVPVILNALPNDNNVLFKKAYSTVQTNINSMINDDANYPLGATILTSDTPAKIVARGFNFTQDTLNGTRNKFCFFFFDKLKAVTGGTNTCTSNTTSTLSGPTSTSDGIRWSIYTAGSTADQQFPISTTSYGTMIIVDINGSKGPNCTAANPSNTYGTPFCASDPDTFYFSVGYDGNIRVGDIAGHTDAVANSYLQDPTADK